jgi:hypothetical protein
MLASYFIAQLTKGDRYNPVVHTLFIFSNYYTNVLSLVLDFFPESHIVFSCHVFLVFSCEKGTLCMDGLRLYRCPVSHRSFGY